MDATDRKIIATLQENGRITNVELARLNNLAPSSMLERVRRLEERGIIGGYRAELDPREIGYDVEAYVMIVLDHHQAAGIEGFESGIRGVPEVRSCVHVAGRYDYILHVAVRDIEHLGDLIKHRLGSLAGVEKQETFLVLSTVKCDEGYSLEPLFDNE